LHLTPSKEITMFALKPACADPETSQVSKQELAERRLPSRPNLRLRVAGTVRTQGEIEAAICQGISRFVQEYMGRGPKDIHAHLIGDLLVVRLQGVFTAAEQQLVKSLPTE